MFVGRKQELDELNKRFFGTKKEFGVIYGRRRIGKSYLINEFLKDKNSLFYQAKEDSKFGNLKSLSYEIDKLIDLPNTFIFESYESAIDALIEHTKEERFVFAIDEYPYIIKQDPSFPSVLQNIIDKAPNNIFFLISGSDISMLKNEIENHNSPLYKRRTFEMEIKKLKYKESLEYLTSISNEDKVRFLSLTSTYPYYLSAFDFSKSFEDNVKDLLFNPYGTFFSLPDQLLSNSTKTQDIYNSILYAVSKRKRTIKDIAGYIHEEDAKVSKYISLLLSQELLDKRETYMGNKKTTYYEIGDPMLKFWYMFIFDNLEKIKINGLLVFNSLKNEINNFVNFGFEDISRLFMDELNMDGKLGDVYNPFKPYKVEKSILNRSVEIDGLSDNGNTLIVMECKYRNTKFSLNMFNHLVESASVFPSKLKREYYLFSKSGFTSDLIDSNKDNVHLYTLDDLFNI